MLGGPSLAWKNLTHQPIRAAVSIGGISFAIILMYMQLGFLGAVGDTATNLYDRTDCDLVLRSPEYLHVFDSRSLPESALRLVAPLPLVAEVHPIDLTVADWRNPNTGEFRPVALIGIDPDQCAIQLDELQSLLPLIRHPGHVLVDRLSRHDYGPTSGEQFGPDDVGRQVEVSGQGVKIIETFEMGTGLAANGLIAVNRTGFKRLAPGGHEGRVSLVLITLNDGIDAATAAEQVRTLIESTGGELSATVTLTRAEALAAERWRWLMETPIGLIFAMGVALAVLVGGVVCYMVLGADVLAHLPEYATLKAMGYSDWFLFRILLSQALILAVISLVPATALTFVLYRITSQLAGIPIHMTTQWIILVTLLTLFMCGLAGLIAMRRLNKAEPANLF